MTLAVSDFAAFFNDVHGHGPFPWQERLLRQIAESGEWPAALDLPTGSGKTAAIDIAVFHLALEADRRDGRKAPIRISFVVDRRLVVDDAFERASRLAKALADPQGRAAASVAQRLLELSGDGPPLIARRLRGGIPREDDWARTPSQPTVLCSTVDQVGSRLLFRGYGVSDSMKPLHAGLLGSDCLILLDEAHLAEAFRQTLGWLKIYQGQNWREADTIAPWGIALLTATPGQEPQEHFSLDADDREHPVLKKRLDASKPVRLIASAKSKANREEAAGGEEEPDRGDKDLLRRATAIVAEVRRAIEHFKRAQNGTPAPSVGVVVNRVARARAVFELLNKEFKEEIAHQRIGEPILMIGPARPLDRDGLARTLDPIRTRTWNDSERRILDRPLLLIATQCVEVGVDIDLDALVSEAAPLDALRQRFGRLNRAGRDIVPYASIVAMRSELSERHDDPIYEKTIKRAWDHLIEVARKEGSDQVVDFGLNAFGVRMQADALAPKADAPVLLPAHIDLLSQTSPMPAADPDLALYLHGPNRQGDSIAIVWRADVDPENGNEETRRLLTLVPPRSTEAIGLPIWAVRRWLIEGGSVIDHLADVSAAPPEEKALLPGDRGQRVFRWKGEDESSRWISAVDLHPGDTIVAPARYGGVDDFGWNPDYKRPVSDLGQAAASPFAGRRFAVRVAPGLIGESVRDQVVEALASTASQRWQHLRAALVDLALPETVRNDLELLDHASKGKVVAYTDLYGTDDEDRARGVVFIAPFGIQNRKPGEDGQPNATEDDMAGSMPGFPLSLEKHSEDVERMAEAFATAAGLPAARVADLKVAGRLHDAGKADPRFQAWLHYGDPLGMDPDRPETILAKSGRRLPRTARDVSGLPEHWRHEALSVRRARADSRLTEAPDPQLVLWLIGTHHGFGRPLFPHHDTGERAPDTGPQSLAFDWRGLDWASLFAQLKARYGVWELARMEAIVRLADHRASGARAVAEGFR